MAKTADLQYVVDRLEDGGWVVLEDASAKTFAVPQAWLPAGVREGDVVSAITEDAEGGRWLRFVMDSAAREKRAEEAKRLRERLPKGPKGDISL